VLAIKSGTLAKSAASAVGVGELEPVMWQSAGRSSSPGVTIRSRRVGRGALACRGRNRADARDLTTGDIKRQHADQSLLSVEKERSRAAVDLDRT
jgi:hypothetical protein